MVLRRHAVDLHCRSSGEGTTVIYSWLNKHFERLRLQLCWVSIFDVDLFSLIRFVIISPTLETRFFAKLDFKMLKQTKTQRELRTQKSQDDPCCWKLRPKHVFDHYFCAHHNDSLTTINFIYLISRCRYNRPNTPWRRSERFFIAYTETLATKCSVFMSYTTVLNSVSPRYVVLIRIIAVGDCNN